MTLRYKLQALTAPCREVDAEIAVMFRDCPKIGGDPDHWLMRNFPPEAWRPYGKGCVAVGTGKDCVNFTSAKFTASLDATVELIERELPYAEVCLNIYGMAFAMVYNGGGPSKEVEHHHTIPAVALLLALLDTKGIE